MKRFLHILIFVLLITALFCVSASAASSSWTDEDGRTWNFDYFEKVVDGVTLRTATIKGANLKADDPNTTDVNEAEKRTSELNIPSIVKVGDVEYTVTKIADNAFKCGDNYNSGDVYLAKKYFGHVTLPETLEEIGSYAFAYSAIYGEIVIPDSVTKIGNYAFRGCVGLDTVIYTAGMDTVPQGCFYDCKALVKFAPSEGGLIKNYSSTAFYNCQALIDIEISTETLTIGSSAFDYCYCINGHINLPNLTKLEGNAFRNCSFIEKVTLGKCAFNQSAFSGCKGIKEFVISEENENYCTVDGVVFNKDKTVLWSYPCGKLTQSYTIPETVITVESNAFNGAAALKHIYIGSNVTTVKSSAFRSTGVESMYFPINVTTVDSAVLYDCADLVWVVFEKNITKFYGDMVKSTGNLKYVISTRENASGITNNGSYPPNFTVRTGACIDKFGAHFYGYLDTPAACEEKGENVCCLCGEKAEVAPLGHIGQILRTSELSCTTNESITVKCVNCNTEQEIISEYFKGHQLGTSTTASTDVYSHSSAICTVCGTVCLDSFNVTAYKGGDANGDGKVDEKDIALLGKIVGGIPSNANMFACDVNSDGKVDGVDLLILKQYVSNLGATISKNTNACSKHVHITTVIVTRESCTNGGLYVYFCADCGASISQKEVAPRGHSFVESIITESTCDKAGKASRDCANCDYADEVAIEKLPHKSSWWMLSDFEKDYEYSRCPECGTLEYREVNRSILNEIVLTIPENYIKYCTAESAALLKPIVDNAEKALTQEQVDILVEEIRRVLPTIQYKVNDVPVIYLETSAKLYKDMPYESANIVVAYYDDNGKLQTLTDSEGQMKVRGNATAGVSSKYPFNIKFSRKVDLFGMFGDNPYEETAPSKKYRLLANALDTSLMRNALAFEFAQDLGLEYTCKYRFVEVHVNGVFRGCYMLTSPIDIGEESVNIDEEKDVIIHLSKSNGSDAAAFPSPIFGLYLMRLEQPSEYTAYTRSQMMRTMYQLDFAILSGDTDEMAKYMDMDSMLAYFIFHEYVKDMDMIWDSTRFYIEDGKLHGGPVWDLDISQGNVKRDSNGSGFDERSAYHYWNQEVVYGDIVTRKELNALGEFASAIGPWADAFWANDRSYGTSNPSLNNGQRRWWFSYMIEYSAEFRGQVATFIKENEQLFKNFYDTNLIDPETEKPIKCIIDELATGKAGTALNRNYQEGPFGAASHPNNMVFCEDNTLADAVIYLRTWWQHRCEWLYDYYTSNFLPEDQK